MSSKSTGSWWLCLLIGLCILQAACPVEDDDGGGGGGGNGSDVATDAGADLSGDGASSDILPLDEVAGSYAVVSITLGGATLTTSNADLGDGVQRRVDGTLGIDAAGTYTREFHFYEDDVLTETETASGTWELESGTVLVITEDGEDASRVQYSFSGDTLTLTRLEGAASFQVDEMVLQRITR